MFINVQATKLSEDYMHNMINQEETEEGVESLRNYFNYVQNCIQKSHIEGFMYANLNAERNINSALFSIVDQERYGSMPTNIKQSQYQRSKSLQKICIPGMYLGSEEASLANWKNYQNACREARKKITVNTYGVADNLEQIKSIYQNILDPNKKYTCLATPIEKGNNGGWRWHKWGPYIGTQKPTMEYIDQEPLINLVYVYHIYEVEEVDLEYAIANLKIHYKRPNFVEGDIFNHNNELVTSFGKCNFGEHKGKFYIGRHDDPITVIDKVVVDKLHYDGLNRLFKDELLKLTIEGKL